MNISFGRLVSGEYDYTATRSDRDIWMVRRFKIGQTSYEEAEIESKLDGPMEIIKLAIERGSWA